MPLTKIQFKPGINKEGTNYSNEGGYYNCDKVRFRSGYPEKIGGWQNQSFGNTYNGVNRSMINWTTYDGYNLLGFGTNQKYYIEQGGTYNDITPLADGVVTLGLNPFTVSATLPKCITVTAVGHGASPGTFVTLTSTTTVGGLTISGTYEIITVPDGNSFTIASPTPGTPAATGGGTVTAQYLISAGNSVVTAGVGWGNGPWGGSTGVASTGWGMSGGTSGVSLPLRLWSQDIFEQDLLMAPVGGDIYYWTKDTATYARAVTLESKANSAQVGTTTTTAISAAGATTITVASTDGISTGTVISGTNIPAGTYVTTSWDYSTTLTLSAAISVGGVASGATITFYHAGLHVPNKTNFIIASDTSHFTIALGSNPYNPTNFNDTFDPMLVRWSDQDDPYGWVPSATNQSGEQHLSNGSYLVCAQNTRQEILVWSNSALFSMQYVGPPYVWNFTLIGDNTSVASPNAAIAINTVSYWMGVDKFYVYNGRLETLYCPLWRFVFDNINYNQLAQVVCGSNEGFSEVWWHYPSANSDVNDSYIVYQYVEQTWYYGSLNRSAWLDSPLRQYPMAAFSVQNSYLSTNVTATDASVSLIDSTSYPETGTILIDSEYITYTSNSNNTLSGCTRGVNNTTAVSHTAYTPVAYNVSNQVMFHEVGCDDKSTTVTLPIAAYLESSDFDIGDGNNFSFVTRVIPDVTFRNSTATNPTVMLTFKARTNSTSSALQTGGPGSAYQTTTQNPSSAASVTRTSSAPVEQYTSQVFVRVRGRQMSFRVENSDLGVAWQVGAMRFDVRQDGRR